ncbi:PREDICTED: transmembrane and ubiquitin-like domain-containing protein 1 [Dinoponera quadriceps]|uniref:Transmembrane and ubiquitin-like domain-containing protein 1 n=1 Tax=Dinoponera quadriceps TaxID=609295 RepID=A0A6P3Y4T9_DINQU|nr:PREDICTED: transmembrane and ubiquitin-like domain-containing protein 1 [Dinoponera quadriceps]XP_014485930.1 PREDICTED: transmembrane and ubiquitin-like domain-containing protein 1 [Dinoponera quadriceps]XP_014485931.1 PREDICTED: transmembrane and ubiquitin-like domain-containing protein 1 [Dinoponera quadriceps]
MSLIEGIGDEVTNFFIVMSVLVVGWLAWCSTSIADQPLIRTVLILRDRAPTRIVTLRANHQNTSSNEQPPSAERTEEETIGAAVSANSDDAQSNCPDAPNIDTDGASQEVNAISLPPTTEEVLLEAMDSYSNDGPSLLQRSVKTNNTDEANTKEQTTSAECTAEDAPASDNNDITIKLKFINDDQKQVTGSLKEMLGEFKRRHFQMELEARKSVRLVFNGRVLQPDTQTLEQCGLFNECVVHCWVHQPRPTSAPSSQASTLDGSSPIYFNSQSFSDLPAGASMSSVRNEWDLSRLLVSILTIVLGLAWYSRYHYAQLFTATTTLALYALTAIFTVSLVSNFFPDQDNIRNVE